MEIGYVGDIKLRQRRVEAEKFNNSFVLETVKRATGG